MSSIASTLNNINSSLLSEINSFTKSSAGSKVSSSSSVSPSSSDRLDFSKLADLFKELGDLKSSDPAKFKQVLSDASAKFKDAASQTKDSSEAGFLNQLSDQFAKASESGDLSALQPPGPPSGSYGGVQSVGSADSSSQLQQLLELLKSVHTK